jgi:type II secretory pathway predicted ATPase ExeA
MYEQFYGLQTRPFELSPDPRFLLLTRGHREALSTLEYALSGRKGVALLVGDAGTGKTTLIHAALASQQPDRLTVFLSNPALTRDEFFEFLADGFQMPEAGSSKTRLLLSLTRLLRERRETGGVAALIIDEAQCLSDALLEEVRLLANIETATEKLLSIILVGQPELAERLNQPSLRQIKQRVGLRCSLAPLDRAEAAAYIATRIQVAGGECAGLFARSAIDMIYERSGGVPRTMSVICDNALVAGYALDRRPVDHDIVLEVCRDLDLASRDEDVVVTPRSMDMLGGSAG